MKRVLLFLPFLSSISFGSVSVNTQWEIRATATAGNVNGCGFVPGASGTDYSQQDAAQYNLTNSSSSGAGNVILSTSAADDMVGNIAHVISGTNFTAGWYEVLSVEVSSSITLSTNKAETSVTTGAGSNGVVNIGGACSLNSTLDDDLFESTTAQNSIGANTLWIKAGSYSIGETVSLSAAGVGATKAPIQFLGYNATRGDAPTLSDRPIIDCGTARNMVFGADWNIENIRFIGSNSSIVQHGISRFRNVKVLNNSTTAGRSGVASGSNAPLTFVDGEAISLRGTAIAGSGGTGGIMNIMGTHMHHSVNGFTSGSVGAGIYFIGNLFENNISTSVAFTGAHAIQDTFIGNTFYGLEGKADAAITYATGATRYGPILGNLFYGYTKPIEITDTQTYSLTRGNNFYNFTNYSTNISTSVGNYELNPQFRNVVQRTGTTATTTSGNHLVDATAAFQTWGITTDDYMCLLGGTGTTNDVCYTIASIDSETQITTGETLTANSTEDHVWEITQYRDFTPGANMRNRGWPSVFYGSDTTSYGDVGAVQHRDVPRAVAQ